MFQYIYEKPKRSDWSRSYPTSEGSSRCWQAGEGSAASEAGSVGRHSRRALPLPPRPTVVCSRVHATKHTVPLKVWIVASASCFAVCAALVLATVVITKWGTTDYTTHYYGEQAAPVYAESKPDHQMTYKQPTKNEEMNPEEMDNEIPFPILEKLSIFKNMVANRDRNKKTDTETKQPETLISKTQIHPLHDETLQHAERKIEKKDKAKHHDTDNAVPEFKPTLPDVFINKNLEIKLPDGFFKRYDDYEPDYYNDENFYEDYIQSTSMTSYLIEKVQELHDWITSDPDFEVAGNATKSRKADNQFGQVLKALNESLIEGNVTIIMNKLKDIYFGDNYTNANHTRKVILSNSTDLLSFGILSLDVMLLHNIQLMAWETQENMRNKMMQDPDVFTFNALFLDPSKVEMKHNEVHDHVEKAVDMTRKRQNLRQDEEYDFGKNMFENVLEVGLSTARAAIHLGRAYKNTKNVLTQLSNREALNTNIQSQLSRNIDGNTHALNRLQTSFSKNDSSVSVASDAGGFYTELDCIWLLYCKNLVATGKLNAPYGTMARINGVALRMLTAELSADKALDTMLYEALTGWTDLRCTDMFPRCSKVNAASIVMESILQPLKKAQSSNKFR